MTMEQALLSAIGSVTTALVFVCRLLWQKSEQCEQDRIDLRKKVEQLEGQYGAAKGELVAYQKCPQHSCPFKVVAVGGALLLLCLLGGCSALDRYERSYSLAYEGASVSLTLSPK